MGIQNFFANFAGIIAPIVTGVVVDRTGAFSAGFLTAAVFAVLGMIAYGLVVRVIEPIDWRASGRLVPATP
jgi:dipeptide/tripeptide permease